MLGENYDERYGLDEYDPYDPFEPTKEDFYTCNLAGYCSSNCSNYPVCMGWTEEGE